MNIIKLNQSNKMNNQAEHFLGDINKRTVILGTILIILAVIAAIVNFIILPGLQRSEEMNVVVPEDVTAQEVIDTENMEIVEKIVGNMEWREETELHRDPFLGPIELLGILEIAIDEGGSLAFLENPPVIQNGRTLVPLEEIMENLDDSVFWNPETEEIIIEREEEVIMYLGEYEAQINGEFVELDVPPQMINDMIMVPLRFISEKLGLIVDYDDDGRMITISVS